MTEKEIKSDIRKLKKLKKQCRAGTEERINLHRQIKDLQANLQNLNIVDKDKNKIIQEILKLDKVMASIEINLTKHTIENLQKYLNKLKGENHV